MTKKSKTDSAAQRPEKRKTAIANSLAQLRGQFGTGRGKDAAFTGLRPRHARLAVNAAATLGVFLFETHTAGDSLMRHLRGLGQRIRIEIKPDEDGFVGRECPNRACEGYFKVTFGTGLKGEGLPCHCPYCGTIAGHDHFWTKPQLAYIKSVAVKRIGDAVFEDLKSMEFSHPARGPFGIGISMKVRRDPSLPIRYYREKQLETTVVCEHCTLRYAIYGVFAFCPDCGQHNSIQILEKNLDVVSKMLDMAAAGDVEVAAKLVENALEDSISAFDGFGRELCRVHAAKSADACRAEKVSFQNLEGATRTVRDLFGVDLHAPLTAEEWKAALIGFQKRHLYAHRMGVVDEEYVQRTGDTSAVVGRKTRITAGEVRNLVRIVGKLAGFLSGGLGDRPSPDPQ